MVRVRVAPDPLFKTRVRDLQYMQLTATEGVLVDGVSHTRGPFFTLAPIPIISPFILLGNMQTAINGSNPLWTMTKVFRGPSSMMWPR